MEPEPPTCPPADQPEPPIHIGPVCPVCRRAYTLDQFLALTGTVEGFVCEDCGDGLMPW